MTLSVYQGTALGADRRVLDWPFHVRVMRETGGTPALAQVFKDEPGSMPLANPINVTADRGWQPGFFRFYAPAGRYRIQIYKGAEVAEELRHVALGTGAQVDLDTLLGSGFNMQFEAATDAPPEAGAIRANNADLSAATILYVSEENAVGSSIAARLAELVAGDSIRLTAPGGEQVSWNVGEGGVTDQGSYHSIAVADHDGEIAIDPGAVSLQLVRDGAASAAADAAAESAAAAEGFMDTAQSAAGTATTQAGIATSAKSDAESAASTATTQAGIATSAADDAAAAAGTAAGAASTAVDAAGDATTQAGVATAAATAGEGFKDEAEAAALAAAAAAAGVNLPVIGSGDAGKSLIVKEDESGYELGAGGGGGGGAGDVADRTALKALIPAAGDARYLKEAGREGWFIFDDSDLSSEVSADTQEGIYVAPASDDTGESGAWVRRFSGYAVARWWGATGDGSSDDTAALQAGINLAPSLGAPLFVPGGDYVVSGLALSSGLLLLGAGMEATTFTLASGANTHVLGCTAVAGIGIRDVGINGQRTLQTGGHGIRIASSSDIQIERVKIVDPHSYGIGIQAGQNDRIYIANVWLSGSGGDGIDIKCKNTATTGDGDGDKPNTDVTLHNIHVSSWGLGESTQQAAIDVRGRVSLSDIYIEGLTGDRRGIRFRFGEVNDGANGVGGHWSRLVNFNVTGSSGTGVGLSVEAQQVEVMNGAISGVETGVQVLQHECLLSNILVSGGGTAFHIDAGAGLQSEANRTHLMNCVGRSCTTAFNIESDENTLMGCFSRSATNGFVFAIGANQNRVLGGGCSNTTTQLTNNGASNRFVAALGITDA